MALKGVLPGMVQLIVSGCVGVPPQHVVTDRMGSGEIIAESWKNQTLLNAMRLRYADAPVFLGLSNSLAGGYPAMTTRVSSKP